jgi:hypothetical protein
MGKTNHPPAHHDRGETGHGIHIHSKKFESQCRTGKIDNDILGFMQVGCMMVMMDPPVFILMRGPLP